jgi:hypothetical protein
MRKSLTRALAGTAIAATAVLTAAGTASATTPAPTTLSISASATTITVGQHDTISGALLSGTTPVANKVVLLDKVVGTTLVFVDARHTGALGKVNFVVVPKATVTYELVFRGTAAFAASNSTPLTVTVNPVRLHTTLSIVLNKIFIKKGQTDTIGGTLRSGKTLIAGRLVWLYRVVGGKLVGGNGHFTDKNGHVRFVIKPSVTTHYILKFFGGPKYAPTHSGVVTVHVS